MNDLAVPKARRDQRGVALVELALVLTFLTTLVFGMIELGNILSDYQNLRQGVREAAREAVSSPSTFGTSAAFHDEVVNKIGLDASRLTITWSSYGSGKSYFEVCVNYSTKSITGLASGFLPASIHSDVKMRIEPPGPTTFPRPAVTAFAPCNY